MWLLLRVTWPSGGCVAASRELTTLHPRIRAEERGQEGTGEGSRLAPHQSLASSIQVFRYLLFSFIINTNLYLHLFQSICLLKLLLAKTLNFIYQNQLMWLLIRKSKREGSVQRFNSIFWFGDFPNDIHAGVSR